MLDKPLITHTPDQITAVIRLTIRGSELPGESSMIA
jgi:hypothetical protein